MARHTRLSVVVPVRDEEAVLPEFHRRVSEVMRSTGEGYEIVYVDDGSRDRTLPLLRQLASTDPGVRVLSLSRTFGHQVALSAGMEHAAGDAVVTIDADLQDPPELIPELIAKWKAGAEVVSARRTRRHGERLVKRACAYLFSRVLRRVATVPLAADSADFRLLDRKACARLLDMRERIRYLRGMVSWLGFTTAEVPYERQGRAAGRPKYRFASSLQLALDALCSFSTVPLRAVLPLGLLVLAGGLVWLVVSLVGGIGGRAGWPVAASALVMLDGVVLIVLGMLGEYVGRILEETKRRPLYVLRERVGFPEAALRLRH
jgi:polyisoprenyl-phosphate glycosyltransferase